MRAWWSLSRAMFKGLLADKTALFFYFLFPLMFLVLFGSCSAVPAPARSPSASPARAC